MGKKYNLEDRLFEKKEKRAKHKKIDTTIGQRKFSRANINRPVGAENAGRIGGLTGEQAFKEILNMSVTRVTTRGGDIQTDLDLNVYPGVMLGGEAIDPFASSDNFLGDQFMYQVVGNPTKAACEIGFAGKRVIQDTIREELPIDFQKAEYLKEHGMVDIVAHRKALRKTLHKVLQHIS